MVIISNIFEGTAMIDYSPFWETLKKTNENWYTLTSKHHMSHSSLHRLKHNQDISMKTVNDLCRILHCQIQDTPMCHRVNISSVYDHIALITDSY